ncbi:MAG TPA: hypothetical protein VGN78_05815 [Solirubrobacteraceae bacterium]|nr:hypothetical protein [Solirubrobacteraceae bacterium]
MIAETRRSWWSASPPLGRREIVSVVLGACVLALVMHWPLPLHLSGDVPKDLGDPLAEAWQLAWDGHALLHQPLHFFQSNQFFPAADTRAYVDGLIGYAPAGLIGNGPVAAVARHNALFFFAYAMAFVGGYLLARELGAGRAGAAVAGAAFAYAPYRLEHDAELNILSSGGIPLALFLGLRGYRQRRPWLVLGAWLVAAWQVTLSLNLALPFAYLLGILAVVAAVSWTRRRWPLPRSLVVATVAGAAAMALVDGVVARPYLDVSREFGPRSVPEVDFYSTGPRAFLAAPRSNLLWGRATVGVRDGLDWVQEQTLFPGVAILALALVGAFAGSFPRRLRIALAGGALVAGWLSLGLSTHGGWVLWPYRLLYDYAPGWDGVRVPERIWLLTMLALALLAADGAQALLRRVRPARWATAVAAALVGLVLLEGSGFHLGRDGSLIHLGADTPTYFGGPPHPAVPRMPPGQRGLPGPQMHLPLQSGEASSPRVVLWSTDGFPKVTTGIGAYQPKSYNRLKEEMRGFPDRRSVSRLRALGVRVVVLHPDLVAGTPWEHAAGRPLTGLALRRRDGGGVVVYRLS